MLRLKGYLYEKDQLSRYCSYFPAFRNIRRPAWPRQLEKRIALAESDDRDSMPFRLREPSQRERMAIPRRLSAPFTYFKMRRWKNVCYVATVRSDLFYWDVGTSVQFTKCPVEHGGPVIVSMIRTSFRAPIRHIRELFNHYFVTSRTCRRTPPLPRSSPASSRTSLIASVIIAEMRLCIHVVSDIDYRGIRIIGASNLFSLIFYSHAKEVKRDVFTIPVILHSMREYEFESNCRHFGESCIYNILLKRSLTAIM